MFTSTLAYYITTDVYYCIFKDPQLTLVAHFKITYHSSQMFVSILSYSVTGTFQGTFQARSGGYNHISELLI